MKYLALISLAFGLVAADSRPECVAKANAFAACPKKCIDDAAPSAKCSAGTKDLDCLCKNLNAIQAAAVPCVNKCTPTPDIGALLNQAKAVCTCQTAPKKHKMI
ncbi:hypothetical protein BT63DRAFT_460193 [Microthyrium microscopicum]|uniref:Extracellular membrane protein CFEM domain-containing protein n=1 Tax=Microthyrium microscopicum TaxID=703497 RepID=A0A6A6TZF6_9PEZI|nr:hypothetical protein BT63DRAFT_460193 [Microthyrium microscopicum]